MQYLIFKSDLLVNSPMIFNQNVLMILVLWFEINL